MENLSNLKFVTEENSQQVPNIEFYSSHLGVATDEGNFIQLPKVYKKIHNVIITRETNSVIADSRNIFWDSTIRENTNKIKFYSDNVLGTDDRMQFSFTVIAEV